jgi:hypothetical protein
MLNATRAVAIVAVLALTGTLALVAGPFAPTEQAAPAATLERSFVDVGRFTGVMTFGPADASVDSVASVVGEVESERGGSTTVVLSGTDARLTGEARLDWNADNLGPTFSQASIVAGWLALENEGGGWEGPWRGVTYPADAEAQLPATTRTSATLTGTGGYDGLTAQVYFYLAPDTSVAEVEALIFPGEFPDYP